MTPRLGSYEIHRAMKAVNDAMVSPGVQLPPYLAVAMPTLIEALQELLQRREQNRREEQCVM